MDSVPGRVQCVKAYTTAAAAAQIESLARDFPYAMGGAIFKKLNK